MLDAVEVITAFAIPVVGFGSAYLSRAYLRVRAVEENRAGLWVWARALGLVLGAAFWTVLRLAWSWSTGMGASPSVASVGATFVVSFAVLFVLDLMVDRWFIDEPSFGTSREAFLEHGSETWIDAMYGFGEWSS